MIGDWLPFAAGLFGLLIGSFLNVVIWRVPRGESLLPASRCPSCHAAIRPLHNIPVLSWVALRGACASCGARISARYPLIELITAFGFAAVTWWFVTLAEVPVRPTDVALEGALGTPLALASWAALVAYLWLAAITLVLVPIDIEHQRLPDAIVLPSIALVTGLLAASALLAGDGLRAIGVVGGAAILFLCYALIVLIYPRGLGGGDVKLAPVLGAALAFVGWEALVVGAFAGFVLGAAYGLVLIALRRGGRRTEIPFGPFMLAGAWIGLVFGAALMHAYLALWALG